MFLLLLLPAAGVSCLRRPQRLLQMAGVEEQQMKGVEEAGWRRWLRRWDSAGPWSPLMELHLTYAHEKKKKKRVKQWALFLVFLFIV